MEPLRPEYLIVGLGNPGRQYELTRHNVGFMAVDLMCRELGIRANAIKCKAVTAAATLEGKPVLLCKPQTFMNLSGESVRQLMAAYDIPAQRVIVIFDDASLLPGRVRVRRAGSAGGHNGIKSLITCMGTDQFPRIKIGIGGPDRTQEDMVDFVLGPMDSDTHEAIARTPDMVRTILRDGVDKAMQQYNATAKAEE